ncbi:hypothetical protein [Metamycoplasma canadense]|uniref:Lipoprotein n=1 Tax=Metamycoplasma canadense TaxID=29554 RepID=A0A077L7C6_9BACT|nr:hypothetical protein [Metamycoplasma canadense]BAP39706.1 hypothetical protein MCAN360_0630 [Metamycoplasma canadense]
MKNITKLIIASSPTIIAMPTVVSCVKIDEIKNTILNVWKDSIVDFLGNVDDFFIESNDPEVIKLKQDISDLLKMVKNEQIDEKNNIDEFSRKVKDRFKELFTKFYELKTEKVTLFEKYSKLFIDFSKWMLETLNQPQYVSLVAEIKDYLNKNTFNTNWTNDKITSETQKFENFILDIKKKRKEIDKSFNKTLNG